MNALKATFATVLIAATGLAFAQQPAVQAPSPVINTEWALAAVELPAPSLATASEQRILLSANRVGDTWSFRELINSQQVEIQITELAREAGQQLANRAAQAARELAGL